MLYRICLDTYDDFNASFKKSISVESVDAGMTYVKFIINEDESFLVRIDSLERLLRQVKAAQ